jgi:hypothetical protein
MMSVQGNPYFQIQYQCYHCCASQPALKYTKIHKNKLNTANKTDRHNITGISLKVAFNTITGTIELKLRVCYILSYHLTTSRIGSEFIRIEPTNFLSIKPRTREGLLFDWSTYLTALVGFTTICAISTYHH